MVVLLMEVMGPDGWGAWPQGAHGCAFRPVGSETREQARGGPCRSILERLCRGPVWHTRLGPPRLSGALSYRRPRRGPRNEVMFGEWDPSLPCGET